tara:strand:- start:4109 stop:6163 length:2055 start_codon:yes stop_codon:yes gene_type:complete
MSLLICASQQQRYNYKESGITRPYSFKNYLGNTMTIPPNSEVAVQSVKIDRKGKFEIEKNVNDRGFIMFGAEYVNSVADTPAEDYMEEYVTSLLPFIIPEGTYKAGNYLEAVRHAMRKATSFHPDLEVGAVVYNYKGTSQTPESVSVEIQQRVSTGTPRTDMVKLQTQMKTPYGVLLEDIGADKSVALVPKLGGVPTFDGIGWDSTTHEWSGRDEAGAGVNVAFFPEVAMSFQAGNFAFDIQGTPDHNWRVGLVRDQRVGAVTNGKHADGTDKYVSLNGYQGCNNINQGLPISFDINPENDVTTDPANLGKSETFFYDYQVVSKSITTLGVKTHELRIYASGQYGDGTDPAFRFGGLNTINEVEYWKDAGQTLFGAGAYDLTTNTLGLTALNFVFSGQSVSLEGTFTAGDSAIVRNRQDSAYNFPPVTTSKYRLYPKLIIGNITGKKIKILDSYGRHINDNEHGALNRNYGNSWFALNNGSNGIVEFGESASSSDCRIGNCIGSTIITAPPLRTADTNKYIDFKVGLILAEEDKELASENNYIHPTWITDGACAQSSLGWEDYHYFLDETTGSAGTTWGRKWSGSGMPEGQAYSSIFVACPTLTQMSQNFAHGTPSKIIYHIPQFDNSGASTGPLFFEASEKTYLRLGNSEPIQLDHLELEIKDSNETLCDELEGNTIIVLHIR